MSTKRHIPKLLSPAQCRNIDDVCALSRDNVDCGDYWLLTDGYTVTICAQKHGEQSTGSVSMKPREFKRFAEWFLKPQKTVKR